MIIVQLIYIVGLAYFLVTSLREVLGEVKLVENQTGKDLIRTGFLEDICIILFWPVTVPLGVYRQHLLDKLVKVNYEKED